MHFGDVGFHCFSDSVAEIPGCLIGDSKRSLNLIGGDAFLRLANQGGSKKPCCERQMGIMKHCPSQGRELIAANVAIVLVALYDFGHRQRTTARATHARRPSQGFDVFPAPIFAFELLHRV